MYREGEGGTGKERRGKGKWGEGEGKIMSRGRMESPNPLRPQLRKPARTKSLSLFRLSKHEFKKNKHKTRRKKNHQYNISRQHKNRN